MPLKENRLLADQNPSEVIMKLIFLSILVLVYSGCKRSPEPTACVKSFVDAQKVSTNSLNSIPGGGESISSEFVAGGFFQSTELNKTKNCSAFAIFTNSNGNLNVEVFTARHCVSSHTKGPYILLLSGEDGYRKIEIMSKELDASKKILDGFSAAELKGRQEITGLAWRPFESSVLRNKIGNKELNKSIEQELGSYAGKLCGHRTYTPTSINAQIGCFMFGDMVSFVGTVKPGSEDTIFSIKKSGNIASNFTGNTEGNWMKEIRKKYLVSRDYEIGSYLSTVYDCSNPKEMKFETPEALCTSQYLASANSIIGTTQDPDLYEGSIFLGFGLKSKEEKLLLIQQSIDNHTSSYGRQVTNWQSMRQRLQKGSLMLGANFEFTEPSTGSKYQKYQLAELKKFQGSIPFIWRPYGILGYIDNSMTKLDKGVSGSMVFLDGMPIAVISRIDGENTSSGSGVPSTGESKLSEQLNVPMGAVFTQAEWTAKNTANTASVDTSPVNVQSPTSPSTVGSPNPGPSALPGNTSTIPSTRRTSADASQALEYGGSTPGC
jgi:hypothetical protein